MGKLDGKAAFVTGGSKGIGLACALHLAKEGADICLAASNEERLRAAAAEIEKQTAIKPGLAVADLRALDGCEASARGGIKHLGGCDILVNAAGATKGGIFPEQPDDEMLDGFALKFHGAVRLCRLLWPELKQRKGTVINICGGFARTPSADFMVGGAVNAALANFSKALAEKGLEDDVNVNWIHPGLTVTERLESVLERRAKQQGKTRAEIQTEALAKEGIRRLGQPADVAATVAYLCSPEARHLNGSAITIDGGGAKGYQ